MAGRFKSRFSGGIDRALAGIVSISLKIKARNAVHEEIMKFILKLREARTGVNYKLGGFNILYLINWICGGKLSVMNYPHHSRLSPLPF